MMAEKWGYNEITLPLLRYAIESFPYLNSNRSLWDPRPSFSFGIIMFTGFPHERQQKRERAAATFEATQAWVNFQFSFLMNYSREAFRLVRSCLNERKFKIWILREIGVRNNARACHMFSGWHWRKTELGNLSPHLSFEAEKLKNPLQSNKR